MRIGFGRLLGPAALAALVLLSGACVVALQEEPTGRVRLPPPPPPIVDEDYGAFYDALDPYGEWSWTDPYGWVFNPARVAPGWRPYTIGRWIDTDDGWFWESDEPWGWATYHYGRWTFDPGRGWVWIPGREWAPAWVAWRHGDGWIGWAPLPPRAVWRAGIGLDLGRVDIEVDLLPFWWGFVEERSFLEPRIGVRILPPARNVTLVRVTRNVTNYTIVQNRVVVRGVDRDAVERAGGRKIAPYRIVDDDDRSRGRAPRVVGNELRVFRPAIKEAPPSRAPRNAAPPAPVRDDRERPGRAVVSRPSQEEPAPVPRPPKAAPQPPAPDPRAERPAPPKAVPQPPAPVPRAERPALPKAAPQPPAPVPAEMLRRQQAELREFERRQAAERNRLEQLHRKETRGAPGGVPPGELRKRQDEERRALEEDAAREKSVIEKKQEREREGKPAANDDKAKKRPAGRKKTGDERKGD